MFVAGVEDIEGRMRVGVSYLNHLREWQVRVEQRGCVRARERVKQRKRRKGAGDRERKKWYFIHLREWQVRVTCLDKRLWMRALRCMIIVFVAIVGVGC